MAKTAIYLKFLPQHNPRLLNQAHHRLIAQRVHRDRSAVKRDVDQLAQVGLVTIETQVLPGHSLMKEVRATANSFRLEALVR
jgi:predicted transcriptional regulator